ncbi:MAG: hypothetical protein ABEN55_03960 [Bradymonadaceae bacterium]
MDELIDKLNDRTSDAYQFKQSEVMPHSRIRHEGEYIDIFINVECEFAVVRATVGAYKKEGFQSLSLVE